MLFAVFCISCGNDGEENSNRKSNSLEGIWGLVHIDSYDLNINPNEPYNTLDLNPSNPSGFNNKKVVISKSKDDLYIFNAYMWSPDSKRWEYANNYTVTLDNGKLLLDESYSKYIEIVSFNSYQFISKISNNVGKQYSYRTFRKLSDDISQYNNNNNNNNNNSNNNNNNNSEKSFYIKYEMNVSFSRNDKPYMLKINYVTDKGSKTLSKDLTRKGKYSWDGTYGPFKKGDKVSLDCNSDLGQYPSNMYRGVGDYEGRIWVKEGNGDYVIKADGTSGYTSGPGLIYSTGLHLSYTLQ